MEGREEREAQLHLEHEKEEERKEEFVIDLFRSRTSILSTYKGVKVDLGLQARVLLQRKGSVKVLAT